MGDDDKDISAQELDALDTEGNWIARREHGQIHGKGYWHRYVHTWLLNVPDESVLMQRRSANKTFGGMWTCCFGHVSRGDPSMLSAQQSVYRELGLQYAEADFDFAFSCKEESRIGDQLVKQLIDVYVVPLEYPPDTAKIHVDKAEATSLKYVSVEELEQAYNRRHSGFAIVNNVDYPERLFRALVGHIRKYVADLPNMDSDEERYNKKSDQLLDTIRRSKVHNLELSSQLDVLAEPAQRGDVYSQSIWHRAVHVWLVDSKNGMVLMLRRASKKRHFGGQWNCSSAHVKIGDSSLPTAVKSISENLGLTRFKEEEFQFLFQAKSVVDTGGGAHLRQVLDVFCVVMPSLSSYAEVPKVEMMKPEKGEVDDVQYMPLDVVQQAWSNRDPQFVIPSSAEYSQRLFFLLRRKVHSAEVKARVGQST